LGRGRKIRRGRNTGKVKSTEGEEGEKTRITLVLQKSGRKEKLDEEEAKKGRKNLENWEGGSKTEK